MPAVAAKNDTDAELTAALGAVDAALAHVQAAQADGDRTYDAAARVHVAARRCLRLSMAVQDEQVVSKRLLRRRAAICELVEQHAGACLVMAAQLRDGQIVNGARRRMLADLLTVLSDLGFYLDVLGRGWSGEL